VWRLPREDVDVVTVKRLVASVDDVEIIREARKGSKPLSVAAACTAAAEDSPAVVAVFSAARSVGDRRTVTRFG
jgi:hypothetical protein